MRMMAFAVSVSAALAWPGSVLADRASATAALKTETQIKDLTWPDETTLYVGMFDLGTRRHGYAMYVCEVLASHGASKGVYVKIIDIVAVAQKRGFRKLGDAYCR